MVRACRPARVTNKPAALQNALTQTLRADTPASIDLPVIKGRKAKAAVVEPSISGSREQLAQIRAKQKEWPANA